MPGPLELRELKRRERRAPLASAVQDAADISTRLVSWQFFSGARVCDPQRFRQPERARNELRRLAVRMLLRLTEPRSGKNLAGQAIHRLIKLNYEYHRALSLTGRREAIR